MDGRKKNHLKIVGTNSILKEYKSQLEEEKVLQFVSLNPDLNIYTIAKYLEINRSHLLKIINKLEKIGILKTKIIMGGIRTERKVYVRDFSEEGSILKEAPKKELNEWINSVDLKKAKEKWI